MARGETALEVRSIPKIWPGATVAILGSGPSIKDVNLDTLFNNRSIKTIGVNHAFRLGPVDILWFGDHGWYQANQADIDAFAGLKLTCDTSLPEMPWPHHIKRVRRCDHASDLYGIEAARTDYVRWNNNSGGSAINVAYHLGAAKVLLLGFDMRRVKSRLHYHDHYPERDTKHDPFVKHLPCFTQIAADAEALGLEIVNCTPGSAITQFPTMRLEEALK